jgi:hypothetical protein
MLLSIPHRLTLGFLKKINIDPHNMHTYIPNPMTMNTRTQTLPLSYEHLWRTEHPTDLEIPEVTIGASLSTGTPLTT